MRLTFFIIEKLVGARCSCTRGGMTSVAEKIAEEVKLLAIFLFRECAGAILPCMILPYVIYNKHPFHR